MIARSVVASRRWIDNLAVCDTASWQRHSFFAASETMAEAQLIGGHGRGIKYGGGLWSRSSRTSGLTKLLPLCCVKHGYPTSPSPMRVLIPNHLSEILVKVKVKIKVKVKVWTLTCLHESDSWPAALFTISEVAADWHEPMVPQRIMWPSIASVNGQLDPRCS